MPPRAALNRRLVRAALLGVVMAMTTAHVGSPNTIFDGRAGKYPVRVIVRPPDVIPGLAEVSVRVLGSAPRVTGVRVRPVFWRTGRQGSPAADDAVRVPGPDMVYAGNLWLMAPGSYTIDVEVTGDAGRGTLSVPVAGVPTAEAPLGAGLTVLLCVLGALLVVGLLSIVHAAAGEALAPPGSEMAAAARRRARIAVAVAVPVVLALTLGGWRWWHAEAEAYRRTLDRPLDTRSEVIGGTTLRLEVTDSAWGAGGVSGLFPDHGRIMHMFVIEASGGRAFAHLHPEWTGDRTFTTSLPPLPAGRYHVMGDIVHESGLPRTLVSSVTVPRDIEGAQLGPDDAWRVADTAGVRVAPDGIHAAIPGGSLVWLGASEPIASRTATTMTFALRDPTGAAVAIEPYMGMNGHAVVLRDDASVFIHLHPTGTVPVAAQAAFAARERGDRTDVERPRAGSASPASDPLAPVDSSHAGHAVQPVGIVGFPYEFPRAGTYTVWVQVKRGGQVVTGRFSAVVR